MAGEKGVILHSVSGLNLKIYLSEVEVKMMKKQARKRGLSVPDYIRYLIKRKEKIL